MPKKVSSSNFPSGKIAHTSSKLKAMLLLLPPTGDGDDEDDCVHGDHEPLVVLGEDVVEQQLPVGGLVIRRLLGEHP